MFEEIDKEFIRTHKFSADVALIKYSAQSFRISGKNLPSPPDELQSQLRKNFAAIMAKAFGKDYAAVESRCYINAATMRKYLNGGRAITPFAVAKICIGAKLSVEEAYELFKLCGHILSPNDFLLDAIIVDALKCGESIEIFYEETKRFGFGDFWKKFDKLK